MTIPRMLLTQIMGDVASKPAAVSWALDVLDLQWRPLLETALAERGQQPWDAQVDPELVERTLEFIRDVGRVAEEH